MITVNLKGGLGNQMFQYALGRKLSLLNGTELMLDTSGLSRAGDIGDAVRPFSLGAFRIKAGITARHPLGILSKLARAFETKVLRRVYIGWVPSLLTSKDGSYLDGYFQSPKYFEDIRDTLLEEFSLAAPLSSEAEAIRARMQESESVFVHVRRGDYVSNEKVRRAYGACSPAYYARAVEELRSRVANPVWFVFSDDIAWARENLELPGETVYVSGQALTDAQELALMMSSKHAVIANSSFSWWGAWLERNPGKVVIAPSPWFDTRKDDHKDLIPDSWILIPKN